MDVLRRADRAQLLLQDEVLNEALDGLMKQHIETFTGRGPEDAVMEARHAVWALEALRARLQSFVDDAAIFKKRQSKAAPS